MKTTVRFNKWISITLLTVNLLLLLLLVEELIDATEPNYGVWSFLMPVFGWISFYYIRITSKGKVHVSLKIMQGLNVFFIVFPLIIIGWIIILMV
ncbi:hypothetical protein BpOF4_18175 [Alkalihalophilus pseudofirmus OF4]|uniref:Uncharacterized protein n=1 Tax=Alkalihalophilus pseudofirmus (strain ATCC BAA-2126 / JCM 17055 / OF4) TaxID=398511 RepID=D3FS41_ALKPO|nr:MULTISPECIES: hypothetical protein [Alkalihalophilus]ADC51676.1 hypothetical protein BpOF4_18175 [Alkalihalophilus pseudofirmus OF4]MED1600412.1 hypothetical protein [Alkalihalophilus marmarensis]